MFNITGTLKVKGASQQVSDKFKKREFVITDNSSQYPQLISFQLTQDKCGLLDSYSEGSEIKVYFNLRGREWKSPQGEIKYFNSLEAWKIEGAGAANNSSPDNKVPEAEITETFISSSSTEDDLPF
jgi:hypothetical protein